MKFKLSRKTFESLLKLYIKQKTDFFFIQIGACDGKINDPLFNLIMSFNLKGILIEPQKDVFEKELKKTYQNSKNLTFVNAAISNNNEVRDLYKISFSKKRWANGLATFDIKKMKEFVTSSYVKECATEECISMPSKVSERYIRQRVPCITLKELIQKKHVHHIDLLQIDTEGFDYEILKSHDFNQIKPTIVNYEDCHLSKEDKRECRDFLQKKGYILIKQRSDTVAFLNSSLNIMNIIFDSKINIIRKINLIKLSYLVRKYSLKS